VQTDERLGCKKRPLTTSAKPSRFLEIPKPDVRIQEQSQSPRTSHSFSSFDGDTMSPRISNVPFIDPIQAARSSTARRRYDFGHWFAKPGDSNRLFRGANLFEHGETPGFEF
jgi:hypothetical protein